MTEAEEVVPVVAAADDGATLILREQLGLGQVLEVGADLAGEAAFGDGYGQAAVRDVLGRTDQTLDGQSSEEVAETPFVVDAGGRQWFANCGWDAFGIAVVLRSDASIRTTCPDCAEPLSIDVRDYRALDRKPVFHVLVPARDWWSDIGFT